MKFQNNTNNRIKFCLGEKSRFDWVTVRPNETIDLEDEDRATAHGLVKCEKCEDCEVKSEESSIGKVKVETKKIRKKKRK